MYSNFTYTQYSDGTINLITIHDFCNRTNTSAVNYGPGGWPTASGTIATRVLNCSIGSGYSLIFDKIQNPPA